MSKRALDNPEHRTNVKRVRLPEEETDPSDAVAALPKNARTWTHTTKDGKQMTRLRRRTDTEINPPPKPVRTWTHTTKDGKKMERLRRRTDTEINPPPKPVRTWTRTDKGGEKMERLRKRTQSEFPGKAEEEDEPMDDEPGEYVKPVAEVVEDEDDEKEVEIPGITDEMEDEDVEMKEDEPKVEDDAANDADDEEDSIEIDDLSASDEEMAPEPEASNAMGTAANTDARAVGGRLTRALTRSNLPIAQRRKPRNKLRRVGTLVRLWDEVHIGSSGDENEDEAEEAAPPALRRTESWNPNYKKKRKLAARRQEIMGRLRNKLPKMSREDVDNCKPSHCIWFDLDERGDEYWWCVKLVDHVWHDDGPASELKIQFSGYSDEDWFIPAISGDSRLYWPTKDLFKKTYKSCSYEDNFEATKDVLRTLRRRGGRRASGRRARRRRPPSRAAFGFRAGGGLFGFGGNVSESEPEPSPPVEVTIKGQVTDAQDAGVTINAKLKILCTSTQKELEVDVVDGKYECQVDTGDVQIEATAEGYAGTTHIVNVKKALGVGAQTEVCMSRVIEREDDFRCVLRWGRKPTDLDSHVYCPAQETQPEIKCYYVNKNYAHNDCRINLDRDVTSGYGPETVTIEHMDNLPEHVQYLDYIVHNYSGENYFTKSRALINVYNRDQCQVYQVPITSTVTNARYWHVFRINRQTKEMSLVNAFSQQYPLVDSVQIRKIPFSESPKAPAIDTENKSKDEIQIVFSFDTTGSMYSCLDNIRAYLKEIIATLLNEIPSLSIGIVAHGDYGDLNRTYVLEHFDFSRDVGALCKFVGGVTATNGFDCDECYELVLHNVQRDFSWSPNCQYRSVVLIGDSNPHPLNSNNPHNIDWEAEADGCAELGIKIYGVHALNQLNSLPFYKTIAEKTKGLCIELDNLDEFQGIMTGICHRELNLSLRDAKAKQDAAVATGASGASAGTGNPSIEAIAKAKKEFQDECDKLPDNTVKDLKDLLRKNEQKISGSKHELIERIADAKLFGCFPRCPKCGGGRLRVMYDHEWSHNGEGQYYCRGYYDDGDYVVCRHTCTLADITRPAWQD